MQKYLKDLKNLLKCDTIRVSRLCGTYFLIIGFNKNTNNLPDESCWENEKCERIDFGYTEEKCVASGKTIKELIYDTRHYNRISKMSWEEYFDYCLNIDFPEVEIYSEKLDKETAKLIKRF